MTSSHDPEYLGDLVLELIKLPRETEWAEFKLNNDDPQMIGEYISALSNSAALNGKAFAYLLWGIDNDSHSISGTSFEPILARKGNEPLETWLLRLLNPRIDFKFHELLIEGSKVVLLQIDRASRHPVAFEGVEYLRVGESKRKLKDYPEKERTLWRILDQVRFEDTIAAEKLTADQVLGRLEYPAYFDLLQIPLPDGHSGILDILEKDRLISICEAGGFNITNLGAILFARKLSDFPGLKRKAVRVIQYRGTGRTETIREQEGGKGYACGFEGLIGYINNLLPTNEVIGAALRRTLPMYPEIAIRELVANALMHQDFLTAGAGPMVEIFDDRIEITNPGEPLVDTQRFIDTPPRSRNELLASLMRRFRICEERGSGIDKVVFQVELFQLPAPLFERPDGFTRAVLFSHKPLSAMSKADRMRACYLHACLRYVMRQEMTNTTLRQRFGIGDKNVATASRLLAEAVDSGQIVISNPGAGTRIRSYLPHWAASRPDRR